MIVPATLTPFSRSVTLAALQIAHRRHAQSLGCQPFANDVLDPAILWDQRPLAGLVIESWGITPERVAHLAGLPTGVTLSSTDRSGRNGAKAAAELAAELTARQERRQRWAQRVFAMQWSQAQLLQVMEEIEPYATDAWFDEQRAAAATLGSYAALCDMIAGWRVDGAAHMDILAGLETPDGALIDDLVAGVDPEQLQTRYGHRGGDELELAAPRLAETGGLILPSSAARSTTWQPQTAQARRLQAEADLVTQAGILRRGAVRKAIVQAQEALAAHAQTCDSLAWVLAAVRRWALAAGREGVKDGRLDAVEEIFWLELEEIKQMMTGEWHSRDHVQPLIIDRKQAWAEKPQPQPFAGAPLGIAGDSLSAPFQRLKSPAEAAALAPNTILVAAQTSPAWAPVIARAGGLVIDVGDFLCHAAAVGRAGGFPTLVAAKSALPSQASGVLELDPANHRAASGA